MNNYNKNRFNYTKIGNKYLITNNYGIYDFLTDKEFSKLKNGEILSTKIMKKLEFDKFIYYGSYEEFAKINASRLIEYKSYIKESTVLHIFVISKTCNYNCIYCQAGNLNTKDDFFMNEEIAKKAVDIAFESPSKNLTFEFQGGEPLTNFETIKYIIDYSKKKNSLLDIDSKKEIEYSIVSNLSLLNDEMVDYIINNNISICTSIDGDRLLQNANRPFKNSDSYDCTIKGLKILQEQKVNVSALLTTTKNSLDKYKEIVDEYIKLGLNRICIRPLTRLGKAYDNWKTIGYTAEEFVEFYNKALEYIIEKNIKGTYLQESMASIFLTKILNNDSINYMELRSPCGAGIGQLAYYYDGNIYTCDEGRMLAEMGDNKFLLGNVFKNNYIDLIKSKSVEEACKSSCIEKGKCCSNCAYVPYCGTCPVINYSQTGSMELTSKNDFRCKINKGILDTLFSYIEKDKKVLNVFCRWL